MAGISFETHKRFEKNFKYANSLPFTGIAYLLIRWVVRANKWNPKNKYMYLL